MISSILQWIAGFVKAVDDDKTLGGRGIEIPCDESESIVNAIGSSGCLLTVATQMENGKQVHPNLGNNFGSVMPGNLWVMSMCAGLRDERSSTVSSSET